MIEMIEMTEATEEIEEKEVTEATEIEEEMTETGREDHNQKTFALIVANLVTGTY